MGRAIGCSRELIPIVRRADVESRAGKTTMIWFGAAVKPDDW
jgi:hypothetical protein